jgi:hypothetical protein
VVGTARCDETLAALGVRSSEPARAPVIAEDLDAFADGEKEHP